MIFQILFNKTINTNNAGLINRVRYKVLKKLLYLVSVFNPLLVKYRIGDILISLPINHSLPYHWKFHPQYSTNVGRVAKICMQKYSEGVIIDIGANIGDTAAIIRSNSVKNRIVSVEGVKKFYDILQANAKNIENVSTINSFVISDTSNKTVDTLVKILPTGNAIVYDKPELYKEAKNATKIKADFVSLNSIVDSFEIRDRVKFLKTDIEGHDLPLLNANLDLINKEQPIIYFECHVNDIHEESKDVSARILLNNLRDIGYKTISIWDGAGDFLLQTHLSDDKIIDDILEYYRNRWGEMYMDICVTHEKDEDVADSIRTTEIEYFRGFRNRETSTL
jgi:FkbM family methyltransferase